MGSVDRVGSGVGIGDGGEQTVEVVAVDHWVKELLVEEGEGMCVAEGREAEDLVSVDEGVREGEEEEVDDDGEGDDSEHS